MRPRFKTIASFILGALFFFGELGILRAEKFAVAPFYGYRFGGYLADAQTGDSLKVDPSASMGATVSMALPSQFDKLEFLYSYQDSELSRPIQNNTIGVRTEVWQLGLSRDFPYDYNDRVTPFLVGLLGVTNIDFSGNLGADTLFSGGLGGGVKYAMSKNIGFRLDLRVFVSLVDGNTGIACNGGACVASYQGSAFFQGEVAPSLVVQF